MRPDTLFERIQLWVYNVSHRKLTREEKQRRVTAFLIGLIIGMAVASIPYVN